MVDLIMMIHFIQQLLVLSVLQLATAQEFTCPEMCTCSAISETTNCSNAGLTALPPDIYLKTVYLDLSHNEFTSIPVEINNLKYLEALHLSHNAISVVDSNSLKDLVNLAALDLSYNHLSSWIYVDPKFLKSARNLKVLNLSFNQLNSLPDFNENHLVSTSLTTLFAENCSISTVNNTIIAGLTNLTILNLDSNPIYSLRTQLRSKSLKNLSLANCQLQAIHPTSLIELTGLIILNMSRNSQLKAFSANSSTLELLDLSDCNLESIPSSNLPRLHTVDLRGNHIRNLVNGSFANANKVKNILLVDNAITNIEPWAFYKLEGLKILDLSRNKISELDPKTFETNFRLEILSLSHNYVKRINFIVDSLKRLDVSVCEIQVIHRDDLYNMPLLQELNVSRNLLSGLPDNFYGKNLAKIDLSLCRITMLNNRTFVEMPRLRYLNLKGNRLNSDIGREVLHKCVEVYLGDNPWRCECDSVEFRELYAWISGMNVIQSDHKTLTCQSPENVEGKHWREACEHVWFADPVNDRAWLYSMAIVLVLSIVICMAISIHRSYGQKRKRERDLARTAERAEAAARLRTMRQRALDVSHDATCQNAPDPREAQRPPSYAEAILLPPLPRSAAGSVGSLDEVDNNNDKPCDTTAAATAGDGSSTDVRSASTTTTTTSTARSRRDASASKRRRRRRRSKAEAEAEAEAAALRQTQGYSTVLYSTGSDDQVERTARMASPPVEPKPAHSVRVCIESDV